MSLKKTDYRGKKSVPSERLTRERIRKGLTQEQLSEATFMSTGLIQKCKQGERLPSTEYIQRMAAFFECAPEYLTGEWNCRTGDEEAQARTTAGYIGSIYQAYKKERETAIVGASFLMKLLGFHFETKQPPNSHLLTVILTSKDEERFEISEPDFMEMLEVFADKSKDTMLGLLRASKAAPGD